MTFITCVVVESDWLTHRF